MYIHTCVYIYVYMCNYISAMQAPVTTSTATIVTQGDCYSSFLLLPLPFFHSIFNGAAKLSLKNKGFYWK